MSNGLCYHKTIGVHCHKPSLAFFTHSSIPGSSNSSSLVTGDTSPCNALGANNKGCRMWMQNGGKHLLSLNIITPDTISVERGRILKYINYSFNNWTERNKGRPNALSRYRALIYICIDDQSWPLYKPAILVRQYMYPLWTYVKHMFP